MSSRIKKLIKDFGVIDGIRFYTRFKTKRLGWFKSHQKKLQFFLRNNKTDPGIYGQVFIDMQYEIPYSFQPKTIIDLGANIGLSVLYFANKFPDAKIVALEPDKDNFEIALQNTKDYSQVKMLQKGVWNKNTFLEIIDSNVSKDAFMVKETENKTGIEATTIETILEQEAWETIDILKIDIEGSEKEVFSGNYDKWLPKTKVIFVEVHDQMKKGSSKAVFNAISKYNFSFSIKHENLVFINEDI